MSGLKKTDSFDWLLIELKSGSRNVVNVKSVVSPLDEELRPGDVIKINWRGDQKTVKLIANARDRGTLDAMVKESAVKAEAEPNFKSEASCSRKCEEAEDSCSDSSWAPSDDEEVSSSDSDSGDTPVKPKMREETCKRATAIRRRHTSLTKIMSNGNLLPDSKKWQNGEELQNEEEVLNKMNEVKNAFTNIFNLIGNLKRQCVINDDDYEDEEDTSDELNRSAKNVLIKNKCNFVKRNEQVEDEWIPIGSGKTMIHKDKFKKVNWTSFTLATRTLLLALFPRRVLATHTLTGKGSPAFKDKPVKMSLDSKIISDVIMEIMDRFDVRENQVRSVITIKCADECKMLRMRTKKSEPKNDENMPPDANNNSDKENDYQEEQ